MRHIPRHIPRPSRRPLGGLAALVVLVGLGLAGCGDGDQITAEDVPTPSAETTSEPGGATLPDCAEVWVAGNDLPSPYEGCQDAAGPVPAEARDCAFGLPLVTFDGRFYALPGEVVNETDGLDGDTDYQQALSACQG